MSQFENLLIGAPESALEFVQYLHSQEETATALAGLLNPNVDFSKTELGASFCDELSQMLGGKEHYSEVAHWVAEASKGNPAFVVGAGMYLEGVKFVADCLLLKKAS